MCSSKPKMPKMPDPPPPPPPPANPTAMAVQPSPTNPMTSIDNSPLEVLRRRRGKASLTIPLGGVSSGTGVGY